jgi:hypothetical protein
MKNNKIYYELKNFYNLYTLRFVDRAAISV